MTRSLTLLFVLCFSLQCIAQSDFFRRELLGLGEVSALPRFREGEMDQLSSYDRTGGNDDGFSGKYSAIRQEPGGLVIADLRGPGVVNRIWTPTPTADTVKFYFDGETTPRLAVPFIELFTGKTFPFMAPLSGNEIGGYYCYLPIPYERSLKIVFAGKNLRFHQTQYRTFSKEDNVKSFSAGMLRANQDAFDKVAGVWMKKRSVLDEYGSALKKKKVNVTLRSGQVVPVFEMASGGRIGGVELSAGTLMQQYRRIQLNARWDSDAFDAIDVPLHDFFGYAFGKPSMQSILLGSDARQLYSYLPMPFDKSARITLRYDQPDGGPEELQITGTIYYTDSKRDPASEGKFYVQSRRQYDIPSGQPHVIADVKGRGHYVGTILQTQGLGPGSTWYFEGDDRATIDGRLRLHGTGSEDYFNGGWYAVMDRWDKGMSLPIHGSLEYDQMTSRTGGYRFYLSDKLTFNQSFQLTIEHQPDDRNNVRTDYTSLGMFYADRAGFSNTPIRLDIPANQPVRRDKLTPQGMVYSLYWLATASYEDPSIVFAMKKSDAWFATIDPEAVPMAQIFLRGLDKGRYKLFVEYNMTPGSGPFSIWQRSGQVSPWIEARDLPEKGGKSLYAGEIEITDDVKTITLRKKSPDTSVRIFSFVFERTD